jgi:hypothetical protein
MFTGAVGRIRWATVLRFTPSFENTYDYDVLVCIGKLEVISYARSEQGLTKGRIDSDDTVVQMVAIQTYQIGRSLRRLLLTELYLHYIARLGT